MYGTFCVPFPPLRETGRGRGWGFARPRRTGPSPPFNFEPISLLFFRRPGMRGPRVAGVVRGKTLYGILQHEPTPPKSDFQRKIAARCDGGAELLAQRCR